VCVEWPRTLLNPEVWDAVRDFATYLRTCAPHLTTLHIVREAVGEIVCHWMVSGPDFTQSHSAQHRTNFLLEPLKTLAGLPLARCGEGYQIGFRRCFPRGDSPYARAAVTMVEGQQHEILLDTARVGVYTYTLDPRSIYARYTPNVPKLFPMAGFPPEVLDLFGKEEREAMARWPEQVLEWKEKSGDALASW
jgi:hypothetical protein